jgi:hypothetical protein
MAESCPSIGSNNRNPIHDSIVKLDKKAFQRLSDMKQIWEYLLISLNYCSQ